MLLGIGFFLGFCCFFCLTFEKLKKAKDYDSLQSENTQLKAQLATEKVISEHLKEQLTGLDEKLTQQFKTASLELFKENAQSFVQLAENSLQRQHLATQESFHHQQDILAKMMEPLQQNLKEFTHRIETLEVGRQKTDVAFKEQLQQLNQIQLKLENKTDLLTHAFCNPVQRGRWGELQLRRIVELSGLLDHVDFDVQVSTKEGSLRPDMIIHLPNDRCVIVDAKTPQLEDYLSAVKENKSEEEQKQILKNCCQRIRDLVTKLSAKDYCRYFPTVDFVVLFFPGDWIFSHALQVDPHLVEYGCLNNVVFATPTLLISLLKSIHYGWRPNKMIEEMKDVELLGSELYERMVTFSSHFSELRSGLLKTVESYNKMLSSLETRMLPTAKKLDTFSKKNIKINFPQALTPEIKTPHFKEN